MADLGALIKQGDVAGVEALLEQDSEAAKGEVAGAPSALLLAIYYGQEQIAASLRRHLESLTLHEAAATGDIHQLEGKLTGEIDAVSGDGFTALGYAAFFNHPRAVERLLAAGANPNLASQNPMGVAPLHSALAGGHKELARMLIDAGADVSAASASGWTPAHYVAHNGDIETARYLVAKGAKTDGVNGDGKTPADLAAGHLELAALLT